MKIELLLNGVPCKWEIHPADTLLYVLRREGWMGVKSGGCAHGECGACTVLMDGRPVNACTLLAAQAGGHSIQTVEALGEVEQQGWKTGRGLAILQEAFIDAGAVQCGYCTPAMLLAAQALLAKNPDPDESEVRAALSGVLCRCTGYQKPVEAVRRAAARVRGENPARLTRTGGVGSPAPQIDGRRLALGHPVYTDDITLRDMLFAKVLHSPHAHARIRRIDTARARALPGVAAVLTWEDLPRVAYTTAGQSHPTPGPLDMFSLDNKVRFVGDRVAFVAAESEAIASRALELIEVDYELLPAVLDPADALLPGAPVLHDETDYVPFGRSDPSRNLAAQIRTDIGDVEAGFRDADQIFEEEYAVPKVQQAHIEPHVAVTWWDEDDRLVIRTSTQVPFHVRRQLAPVLGLPVRRIRVIKPRIGGGFGAKQEILMEDVAAHLTIATGRPVRYELTREEEFTAARSRHPMRLHLKTGVKNDGTITANALYVLSDTGAYGGHAMTVTSNTGSKPLALYPGDGPYRTHPNIRFYADIVYTNTPPAGAFRGYGAPQGFWALERHLDKIAHSLGIDPLNFRLKNALRAGDPHPFTLSRPSPDIIQSCGLEECVTRGKAAIGWAEKTTGSGFRRVPGKPHLRRGMGAAFGMQGSGVTRIDMGAASLKMNDDGSFNLLVGAADLGTGSDTILAQQAAEALGASLDDILIHSSDTDLTPFDKGAYAASTTYISGHAVIKAARQAAERIRWRAAHMFNRRAGTPALKPEDISLANSRALTPDGRTLTFEQIALDSLHHTEQEQIMGIGSHGSQASPPPFAAQFAEVTVDVETGQVTVERLVTAVDAGVVINPLLATGQVEGAMAQGLGYGVCEELKYGEDGQPRERSWDDYHVFRADEMPRMETILVETFEPSHPLGAKSLSEVPIDAVAPAIANAIYNACGAQVDEIPATPERIWSAIRAGHSQHPKYIRLPEDWE